MTFKAKTRVRLIESIVLKKYLIVAKYSHFVLRNENGDIKVFDHKFLALAYAASKRWKVIE